MYKLILFFRKIYVPALFILLEALALHYYTHSSPYTRARLLSASNAAVGDVYRVFSGVGDYFALRRENRLLADEVVRLRAELAAVPAAALSVPELPAVAPYTFTTARVLKNSITRQDNFLLLDKGRRDGVEPEMAVLTMDGAAVGYVLAVSERFATCMSVLNRDFRASGKIAGKEFFGSVHWDGRSHEFVTLSDIPKYADIQPGDTVITAYSSRFPPGALLGTVEDFRLADNLTYYEVRVRLAGGLSHLGAVLLVRYTDALQVGELEKSAGIAGTK